VEFEFHHLDRRYEGLRVASRARDEEVLSSIARIGQQVPIVVVGGGDDGRAIVVDGYKRIRALVRLHHDTVRAIRWETSEAEALLLSRLIKTSTADSALEDGWFVRELHERFDLSLDEIAQRLVRSKSWVSTRLGLVTELPDSIQEQVRRGEIVPHAAMKHLLPLARADRDGAIALAAAIGRLRPTTRQTEVLCCAFARGNKKTKAFVLEHPELAVRAREQSSTATLPAPAPSAELHKDLSALGGIARRAIGRIHGASLISLTPPEIEEIGHAFARAKTQAEILFRLLEEEIRSCSTKTCEPPFSSSTPPATESEPSAVC
jgi:ParB/RepB/Spo0J family partition protein